jgi:hypothetical protein
MNNNCIPITKIKITKDKWLNTEVKYEEELKINDIINDMAEKSYEWIHQKSDLDVISDYDSFKNDFINLIYDKYLK